MRYLDAAVRLDARPQCAVVVLDHALTAPIAQAFDERREACQVCDEQR
ncbi:MAG TPA: hypothetical protein VMF89_33160 [Polyangiales bacterium]|nr:hypothetical protein [Polyangiales bacterium]